jgi:hypothetical protein
MVSSVMLWQDKPAMVLFDDTARVVGMALYVRKGDNGSRDYGYGDCCFVRGRG